MSKPFYWGCLIFTTASKAGENGTCWTSAQEMAKSMGCSRNTIVKYRNKLVKRGWIAIVGTKRVGATQQRTPE